MPNLEIYPGRCKGCGYCIRFCPEKILAISEETNEMGYQYVAITRQELCKRCRVCEVVCPDMALRVVLPVSKSSARSEEVAAEP